MSRPILERAIAQVSPLVALRREAARMALESLGSYAAARASTRANRNWYKSRGSADADAIPDLPELRAASRDLARNAPLAAGALSTVCTNVVGGGLGCTPSIDRDLLRLDDAAADAWEDRAAMIWRHHAGSGALDITGAQCDGDLQDLVLRSQLESGDVLVVRRWVERPWDLLATRVQVIEADRLSTPDARKQDLAIIDGVEIDVDGFPIAYHISTTHPGDGWGWRGRRAQTWERIGARAENGERLVLHPFRRLRPGQTRGVPYFAPVIEALRDISEYSAAELDAAVLSAFFTVFTKTEGAAGLANQTTPVSATPGAGEVGTNEVQLGRGAIIDLAPGEDVTIANPARPNSQFDPFFLAVARQIGVALEIPFELLVKHFTASYSAARAALLEAWKFFRARRHWLVRNYCQPVYEWTMTEAVARGLLPAPGFFGDPLLRAAWLGCEWTGPPPGQLDPVKEMEAAERREALGVSTFSELTQEVTGGDWERVSKRRAKERRRLEELGLPVPGAQSAAAAPAPPAAAPPGGTDIEKPEDA